MADPPQNLTSQLLPDDPINLLSSDSRNRIGRAIISADKFIWETEVYLQSHPTTNRDFANLMRNKARFNKANAIVKMYQAEFSCLDITEKKYREIMCELIEDAANSLELYDSQRRLLETEFFFPLEKKKTHSTVTIAKVESVSETVAAQLNNLRLECRLTLTVTIVIEPF
jgi:hypothetical protein